jgi:hypothetical protein
MKMHLEQQNDQLMFLEENVSETITDGMKMKEVQCLFKFWLLRV